MGEMAAAAAAAIGHPFVAVTGRRWPGMQSLVEGASLHLIAPGPTTRLGIAAGVRLGGHAAVTVVDRVPRAAEVDPGCLAVTTSAHCAAAAALDGWSVVQPWRGADIAPLLDAAARPAVLVLAAATDVDVPAPAPTPRPVRDWADGHLATLIASGPAVALMVRLSQRLLTRGVEVAAVERAILTSPQHAPLAGGTHLLVAGADTGALVRQGHWPDSPVHAVPLSGATEADLVGAVLALVPAA